MSTVAISIQGLRLRSASCAPSEEREAHRLPPPDADALLLERIAGGDQDAVAELYDRHARRAYGLALRVTADPTLAEDAVQEAFCAIWRRADSFRTSRGSATSWVLALVHHKSVDVVRREQARRRPRAPRGARPARAGDARAAGAGERRGPARPPRPGRASPQSSSGCSACCTSTGSPSARSQTSSACRSARSRAAPTWPWVPCAGPCARPADAPCATGRSGRLRVPEIEELS